MSNAQQTADELDNIDSKMEKMGLMETNVTLDVYDKIALFIKVINHAESRCKIPLNYVMNLHAMSFCCWKTISKKTEVAISIA